MNRIGIDLGGTKIEGILMDAEGNTVHVVREATPSNYLETIQTIRQLVTELEDQVGETCPVGMGTPGAWVPHRQVMKNCNSTVLNEKPFLLDLQRVLNRPIRIANDANCMVLSEAVDGAGKGFNSVFGVILGTGVGGGWVVNGQLIEGPNLLAGEWGHNAFPQKPIHAPLTLALDTEVRPCYCGRINCIETYLSGRGLELTHQKLHNSAMPAPAIGEGASPAALETIDEYVQHLALALSVVVNILDPDVIVLAGGLSNIDRIYESLPTHLAAYAFSSESRTEIKKAEHGDSSGRRGAAWLFPPEG